MNTRTPVDVEALRGHTPAPWQVGDGGKYDPPTMVYCDDSLGSRVADLSMTGHGIPAAVDLINARLIAAAPDLLAEVISRRSRDAAVAELFVDLRHALRLARQYMVDAIEYDSPCARKDAHTVDSALEKADEFVSTYRGGAPE